MFLTHTITFFVIAGALPEIQPPTPLDVPLPESDDVSLANLVNKVASCNIRRNTPVLEKESRKQLSECQRVLVLSEFVTALFRQNPFKKRRAGGDGRGQERCRFERLFGFESSRFERERR